MSMALAHGDANSKARSLLADDQSIVPAVVTLLENTVPTLRGKVRHALPWLPVTLF